MKSPKIALFLYIAFSLSLISSAQAQSDNCQQFIQESGRISIPIEIGGQASSGFLNSDTIPASISSALARQAGLEIEELPGRSFLTSLMPQIQGVVKNVPMVVFGEELEMEQIFVIDDSRPFASLSILVFKNSILQVDFPNLNICFLNRASVDLEKVSNILMRSSALGRPAVQVTVNGEDKIWLEFQAGFQGAVDLNYKAANDLGFADDTGNSADAETGSGVIESLLFGPYDLGNINVNYALSEPELSAEMQQLLRFANSGGRAVDPSGSLGYEILKHFVITVDFERDHMHILAP